MSKADCEGRAVAASRSKPWPYGFASHMSFGFQSEHEPMYGSRWWTPIHWVAVRLCVKAEQNTASTPPIDTTHAMMHQMSQIRLMMASTPYVLASARGSS